MNKILRVFVNTLTVNDKHYMFNRDNLTQQIQMQLSEKKKEKFDFFSAFLKSTSIFKHLTKKDDRPSCCISGNTGCDKYG